MRIWISANRIWLSLLLLIYFLTSFHAYKYLVTGFFHPEKYYQFDFGAYYNAAKILNSNDPYLYKREIPRKIAVESNMDTYHSKYIYPPFLAIVLRPIALIPHRGAIWLWMVFNLLLLGVIVRQLNWLIQKQIKNSEELLLSVKKSPHGWATILFVCLIFPPVYQTLILGQVNLLLLFLLLVSYTISLSPDSDSQRLIAGFSLGLAIGIKPFMFIFVPFLWVLRRSRIALYALTTFTITLVIGYIGTDSSTFVNYFLNIIPEVQKIILSYDNHALLATIQRMYVPVTFNLVDSFIQSDIPVSFTQLSVDPRIGTFFGWLAMCIVAILTLITILVHWRSSFTEPSSSDLRNCFMLLLISLLILMPSGWTSTSLLSLLLLPILTFSLKKDEKPVRKELYKSMLYLSLTLMLVNFVWLQIPLVTNKLLPYWILTLATVGMLILWSLYLITSNNRYAQTDNFIRQ